MFFHNLQFCWVSCSLLNPIPKKVTSKCSQFTFIIISKVDRVTRKCSQFTFVIISKER